MKFYDPNTEQPYLVQDLPEPFLFEFPAPPRQTRSDGTTVAYDTLLALAQVYKMIFNIKK